MASPTARTSTLSRSEMTLSRVSERLVHQSHRIPPQQGSQKYDERLPLYHPAPGYCFERSAHCGTQDSQGHLLPPHQTHTGDRHLRDPHQYCAHVDVQQRCTRLCTCTRQECAHVAYGALLTKVPSGRRNPAKRSPHARTRCRKHPFKLVPQTSLRVRCCRNRGPG